MMKNFLLLFLFVFVPQVMFSQVGINTENPNILTALDVSLLNDGAEVIPQGIMVPRMTEAQRDKIDVTNLDLANSLLIYNTTEDCFNFFSKAQNSWMSLCGKPSAEAIFTIDCTQISVNGTYTINTELTSSNYVEILVIVTKAGNYNISGITNENNGYYFSLSGEFVQTGTYKLRIPGFGTPKQYNSAGDQLLIRDNNQLICSNLVVNLRQAEYTIDCNSIVVSGNYIATVPLTSENTIAINITADGELVGYTYQMSTDVINGYSFSGTSTLVEGEQTIILTGSGTPTTNGTNTFTLKSNSIEENTPICNVDIDVNYKPIRILSASSTSVYYNIGNAKNMANMAMLNPDYFGLDADAIFKNSGFVFSSVTSSNKLEASMSSFDPDIILAQYNYKPSASEITALANFVNNGGVLIYCSDQGTSNTLPLIKLIFDNNTTIEESSTDSNNVVLLEDTKVSNGPFYNLTGLGMARDQGSNYGLKVSTLPAEAEVIAYTTDQSSARVVAHKTKGFIFVGDGGPFAAASSTTAYSDPAKFSTTNNKTTAVIHTNSSPQSYNSFLFLNAIAWAIDYIHSK